MLDAETMPIACRTLPKSVRYQADEYGESKKKRTAACAQPSFCQVAHVFPSSNAGVVLQEAAKPLRTRPPASMLDKKSNGGRERDRTSLSPRYGQRSHSLCFVRSRIQANAWNIRSSRRLAPPSPQSTRQRWKRTSHRLSPRSVRGDQDAEGCRRAEWHRSSRPGTRRPQGPLKTRSEATRPSHARLSRRAPRIPPPIRGRRP